MGRYVVSVKDFGGRRGESVRDPNLSASIADWAFSKGRPNLSNGGKHLPYSEDGMRSFPPPSTFSACEAVSLGDARDGILSDPKEIILKLHANWGRASARQIRRVLVDSEGGNLQPLALRG